MRVGLVRGDLELGGRRARGARPIGLKAATRRLQDWAEWRNERPEDDRYNWEIRNAPPEEMA